MSDEPPSSWMHIGLHGHSIGTFTAESRGIRWKSALNADDDVNAVLSRFISGKAVTAALWTVFGRSGHLRIQVDKNSEQNNKNKSSGEDDAPPSEYRFDGFPNVDYEQIRSILSRYYSITLSKHPMSSAGASFGLTDINTKSSHLVFRECVLDKHYGHKDETEDGEEFEPRDGDEMMSMNLKEVGQCVMHGNTRNEIEMQFHESDTVEAGTDQLVSIRFYVPPDPDADPTDKESPSPAEIFQQRILNVANIKNTAGEEIVQFTEQQGTFLTPRGRYKITLFDSHLRMHGNRYDYKIKYDDISRLFLLPRPDDVHMAFVIALDKPIRQGQQRYHILVLQTTKETQEIKVNLDQARLEKEYGGLLQPIMRGSLCNLIAKTFKTIARTKVFVNGKFANAYQQACVKCALRANEGHLYPLERCFVFIHKPPLFVKFEDVESVEFQRYAGGQGSTRNFDLCVTLVKNAGDVSSTITRDYIFSGIDRSDYAGLYNFLSGKKIKIKNIQEDGEVGGGTSGGGADGGRNPAVVTMDDEVDDSSTDDDFGSEDGDGTSSDEEDQDLEMDEDVDSDLEEARKNQAKKNKKKRAIKEGASLSSASASTKKMKLKKIVSPHPAPKKKKKKKDPNAPKKATSSYVHFCKVTRPEIKAENPNATFAELGKLFGKAFNALTSEQKKPYELMAAKDKERYQEEMENYSAPKESDNNDDVGTSSKKKKQKKDPNAPKRGLTSFMFFMKEMRPEFKAENPDLTFGELGRHAGQKFRELGKDQKDRFKKLAEDDKLRYKKEMESYVPPHDMDSVKEKKKKGEKGVNVKASVTFKKKKDDNSSSAGSASSDAVSSEDNSSSNGGSDSDESD